MTSRGDIVILKTGHIITVNNGDANGYHVGTVLWAPAGDINQPGGHNLSISPIDITEARSLRLTGELAAALTAASAPTDESELVVIGEQFRAPHPRDAEEADAEQTLWTIDRVENTWWVIASNSAGEEAAFDFRVVQAHRRVYLFQQRVSRR